MELQKNLLSMQAHILIDRTYKPFFDSNDLSSADIILEHLSCLLKYNRPWFPRSYVYLERGIDIWSKLQSRAHCEDLFTLLDVDSIESMKSLIASCPDPQLKYQRSFDCAPWITDYISLDKIGTVR